ncbi:MAG: Ig domain-containing protein [Desulfurobacteriaceae bacterium]
MKRKAFSLIEAAIVLVILGIILGIGGATFINYVKFNKRTETREKVETAADWVVGYVQTKGVLPLKTDYPNFKDSYGRDIIYIYSPNLTNETLKEGTTLCDVRYTSLNATNNETGNTIENVAFLVFSKGEDAKSDTFFCENGTKIETSTSASGNICYFPSLDEVRVVTLEELKQNLGCVGVPVKIITQYLPLAIVGNSYTAEIFASGGISDNGSYWWCYNGTIPSGLVVNANDCSSSTWQENETLRIEGTPSSPGTYSFKICVKDTNDYKFCKNFSLTVSSLGGGGGGSSGNGTIVVCGNYSLEVDVYSNPWWAYPISTNITPPGDDSWTCEDGGRTSGNYTASGLPVGTYVKVNQDWYCSDTNVQVEGFIQDLDSDGDCFVKIVCNDGVCNNISTGGGTLACSYYGITIRNDSDTTLSWWLAGGTCYKLGDYEQATTGTSNGDDYLEIYKGSNKCGVSSRLLLSRPVSNLAAEAGSCIFTVACYENAYGNLVCGVE